MNKKLMYMTGLICLTIILAGCRAIAPSETSPQEGDEVQGERSEAPTEEGSTVAEAKSAQVELEDDAPASDASGAEENEQNNQLKNLAVRENLLPAPKNELSDDTYVWSQLIPRDGIRPIYETALQFAAADEAPYDDDELVIGVEINGEAKAYAIGPLNAREMVNDTVGGVPILVTW